MSTAGLATTGQRGSFLSLMDCTLVKICLQEILSFPCSFPLLPVLPFWQTLPCIRSRALGERGQGGSSLQNAARAAPGCPGRTLGSRLRFISVSHNLKTSSNPRRSFPEAEAAQVWSGESLPSRPRCPQLPFPAPVLLFFSGFKAPCFLG